MAGPLAFSTLGDDIPRLDLHQQAMHYVRYTEKAASLLDQADRVALFANGDSFLDLLAFQNRMMKLSKSIQSIRLDNTYLFNQFN